MVGLAGIFVIFIALLCIVVAGWFFFGRLVGRGRGRMTQPGCGACGYAVAGLPDFICPECGSDVREVGIVTPQMARPIGPGMAILIWTIQLPIPALALSSITVGFVGPRVIHRHVHFSDASAAIMIQYLLESHETQWGMNARRGNNTGPTPFDTLRLSVGTAVILPPPSLDQDLVIPLDGSIPFERNPVAASESQDESTDPIVRLVTPWLESRGLPSTDPGHAATRDAVVSTTHSILANPTQQTMSQLAPTGMGTGMSSSSPAWLILGGFAFWLFIWCLGVRSIRRRHAGAGTT